jgi:hypothetical protein
MNLEIQFTSYSSYGLELDGIGISHHHTHIYILVGGLEHFLFFHLLGIIIPTDYIIIIRGVEPTNQYIYIYTYENTHVAAQIRMDPP